LELIEEKLRDLKIESNEFRDFNIKDKERKAVE